MAVGQADARVSQVRIVIADVHPVLCESMAATIAREPDFRVVGSATTLNQAIDLVSAVRPDVVILDAGMPSLDGETPLAAFRALKPAPALVMLLTSNDPEIARTCIQSGASAVVLKAAPLQELWEAVRWTARGHMWMSPPLLARVLSERPDAVQAEARRQLAPLTSRELEVLGFLVEGLSLDQIGHHLHISANTARTHSQNLQKKMGVHSAVAAVSVALAAGFRPQ
jgi:DNA-binding NarL/FixJ family response regulator